MQVLENNEDNEENDQSLKPVHAKQYLVFMISNWEPHAPPIKYVIARYACSDGISSNFLITEISKIICGLSRFGWIVNNITGDGASENRTTFRSLATHTMEEVFPDEYFKDSNFPNLPLKKKIAFQHPIIPSIWIFIGGDMPHLMKKIVNCLENSGENT